MAIRVGCVNKTDRMSPHERIQNIGGTNPDGARWKLGEARAIQGIERGEWSFCVQAPSGRRASVIVATHLGRKYLKTAADGVQPDNLLAPPECP
jgi:hypothetical protein